MFIQTLALYKSFTYLRLTLSNVWTSAAAAVPASSSRHLSLTLNYRDGRESCCLGYIYRWPQKVVRGPGCVCRTVET